MVVMMVVMMVVVMMVVMVMAVLMALRCVTSGMVTQTNALLTISSLSLLYLHGSRLFHFGVFIKLILKCF